MEENNTILSSTYDESNEEKDKKNIAGTLVQEELKFSHAQPSQQKQGKHFIPGINETITQAPKSKQEIIQDVILSLAMEQRAIAQFIQAEAKHIQAYIQQDHELNTSHQHEFQSDLVRIVEGLVEKQKMSMRLLDMTKVLLKEE